MKKLVMTGVISTLSALLIVGCAGETPLSKDSNTLKSEDAKSIDYTHIQNELSTEKVHHIIVTAGEEHGWKMTEFKNNAVVAEKFSNDTAKVVTVHFSKEFFHTEPMDKELDEILEEALNAKSEH